MIETYALLISILSLLISGYILFFDRVRLKITMVVPSISGSRSNSDKIWKHSINSISVTVRNKGKRHARNCEGLVTFKEMDALPLYPTKRGEVLTENRSFDILAGDEENLVAAWGFSGKSINGICGFDKGTFLEKAPPIKVILFFGQKQKTKTISEKEIEKLLRKHEENTYKNS